jgi:hypothetical protein
MSAIDEKQIVVSGEDGVPDSPKGTAHSSSASMADDAGPIDPKAERALLMKLDLCIYPVLFVIYMMSFLDRINISNARIEGMLTDLDLKGNEFNIALFVRAIPSY